MDIFDAISKWLQSDEENPFTSKEIKPKIDSKRIVIGYKFGSDMEKPELTISGDVDKEELEDMVKDLMDITIETNESRERFETPVGETCITDDGLDIILEMPGVGKDDINIEIKEGTVECIAKTKTRNYKALVDYDAKEVSEINCKNGVCTISLKGK